jgi:hypothetical protein
MNGMQISFLLSMDEYTSKYFRGIVMRDTESLPLGAKQGLYILNTDVESGSGEHWCVAFFLEGGVCEFFDPFGSFPSVYQLDDILGKRESTTNVYNSICVQDIFSKACGHHCLFFSYYRCRGVSFSQVLKMYDFGDVKKNDRMVIDFITKFGTAYYPMKGI